MRIKVRIIMHIALIFLTSFITASMHAADTWEEKIVDGITVKERTVKKSEETWKELQFFVTSTSGTSYNPTLGIRLYVDNLLDVHIKKIHIIEHTAKPIICTLVERKQDFNGTACITSPVAITVEADYQKPGPFLVTRIPSRTLFDKAFNHIINEPYNGSVRIYKSQNPMVLDLLINDFYAYILKAQKS